MSDVTEYLKRWRTGDGDARNDLFDAVYADLRNRAGSLLHSRGPRMPLQPTELVNESFIKLAPLRDVSWQDRNHFLAIASTVMRQVLSDIYRQAQAQKRASEQVTLVTEQLVEANEPVEFTDLDDALTELHGIEPLLASVVELKFFAGMTNAEIADYLQLSESTVKRYWRTARTWLLDRLQPQAAPPTD